MVDSTTTNLGLTQPENHASDDTWGVKLNTDLGIIDGLFAPTGTGTVVRRDAGNNAAVSGVSISAAAGVARFIQWLTGVSKRWVMGAEVTAESGANAGSNFVLLRYADDGLTVLGIPIAVTRSSGVVGFEATPQVGANQVYHQGNLPAVIASVAEPVGTIKMYAGPGGADPPGGYYMLCNGRSLARTAFPALFSAIGVAYGSLDGASFSIPNTAERVLVGQSSSNTLIPQTGFDATVLGNTFGEGQHTIAAAELPQHVHPISDPGHTHPFTYSRNTQPGGTGTNAVNTITATGGAFSTATDVDDPATRLTATQNSAAPTQKTNIVQPSLVVNFIIRVQ